MQRRSFVAHLTAAILTPLSLIRTKPATPVVDYWPGLPQIASTLPGHENDNSAAGLFSYTQPLVNNRLANAKDPITGNWCTYISRGGYWHKSKPGTPAWDCALPAGFVKE